MRGSRAKFLALTASVLLITILVSGCGGAPSAEGLVVEATEFGFAPTRLLLKINEPTTLTFVNKGTAMHDLTVQGLKVRIGDKTFDNLVLRADPGKAVRATFAPLVTGEFTLLCAVPGHADLGMKGTAAVGQ